MGLFTGAGGLTNGGYCPGQRVGSWGFMLPDGSYVDWEEYKG